MNSIDFVLLWVDGNDPQWQREKAHYDGKEYDENAADACRYRDWDILHYWFRAVEKNAPWVRKIHVVTNGQIPPFLNLDHPKINFVKHADFMPQRYLPTFSARAIEVNLHRIPDLAEQFVLLNDDMFINRPMQESNFFRDGKPCYIYGECPRKTGEAISAHQHSRNNGCEVVSRHYNKTDLLRSGITKVINPLYGKRNLKTLFYFWRTNAFTGFIDDHIPYPLLKSTMSEVWEKEPEILEHTSIQKFRDNESVNQYLFRYWDMARGNFAPWKKNGFRYEMNSKSVAQAVKDIEEGTHALICLNDSEGCDSFEEIKQRVAQAFAKRYPEPSLFEK